MSSLVAVLALVAARVVVLERRHEPVSVARSSRGQAHQTASGLLLLGRLWLGATAQAVNASGPFGAGGRVCLVLAVGKWHCSRRQLGRAMHDEWGLLVEEGECATCLHGGTNY